MTPEDISPPDQPFRPPGVRWLRAKIRRLEAK